MLYKAGGAGPTTPTLVEPKILSFMVKDLYFQSSGRTNNCHIEVLFKWSDQSCTPSAAPAVASPDPDPNRRGWGQLPNPKSAILC